MKIFNVKIDINRIIWLLVFTIMIIFIIWLIVNNTTIHMNNNNYTNVLKEIHDNMDKYIGKQITTTGYIFRKKDFDKNNFVVARDMLINETQANIVGFLCTYDQAQDFQDNEWVEATGTIILGDYFGRIPIIKISTIKRITTPNDIFVNPPS